MASSTVRLLSASATACSWRPCLRFWFEEVVGKGGKDLKENSAIYERTLASFRRNERKAHQAGYYSLGSTKDQSSVCDRFFRSDRRRKSIKINNSVETLEQIDALSARRVDDPAPREASALFGNALPFWQPAAFTFQEIPTESPPRIVPPKATLRKHG
jgi:hypothetical protein